MRNQKKIYLHGTQSFLIGKQGIADSIYYVVPCINLIMKASCETQELYKSNKLNSSDTDIVFEHKREYN